jgi:hypothetical protein
MRGSCIGFSLFRTSVCVVACLEVLAVVSLSRGMDVCSVPVIEWKKGTTKDMVWLAACRA